MKRTLALLLVIVTVLLAFVGCEQGNRRIVCLKTVEQAAEMAFTTDALNAELDAFVGNGEGNRRDRTSFSPAERNAAAYLKERIASFGYEEDKSLFVQDFTAETQGNALTPGVTYNSQNVIAEYNPGKSQRVVISAHYDNLFSDITELGVMGSSDESIAAGATGVSVLLSLARAFAAQQPAMDYTVTMVFYGASELGYVGSSRFLTDWLGVASDVVLNINLNTISGKRVTVYADEVKTNHGTLFLENGKAYATEFAAQPSSLPIISEIFASNLGYSHYAMSGDQVYLFEKGVPSLNFTHGDLNGFVYYQRPVDTLETYRAANPEGGRAMADTASLVYYTVTADTFTAAADRFTQKYDYSFLMSYTMANVINLAVILLFAVALLIVVKALEKKYPKSPIALKKVKLAVFGMEYESKNENEIFVDIRPVDGQKDETEQPDDPFNEENK